MVNLFILKCIDLFGLFDSFRSQHLQSNYFAWLSNYISPSKQQVKNGPIRRVQKYISNYLKWNDKLLVCTVHAVSQMYVFRFVSNSSSNLKCFRDFGHTYMIYFQFHTPAQYTCTCTINFCFVLFLWFAPVASRCCHPLFNCLRDWKSSGKCQHFFVKQT